MFIDTENTFRPERLKSIADRFNLDHDAMLNNVIFVRAYTSEHQFELLDGVAAKFHEEAGVFKLLVCFSSLLFLKNIIVSFFLSFLFFSLKTLYSFRCCENVVSFRLTFPQIFFWIFFKLGKYENHAKIF